MKLARSSRPLPSGLNRSNSPRLQLRGSGGFSPRFHYQEWQRLYSVKSFVVKIIRRQCRPHSAQLTSASKTLAVSVYWSNRTNSAPWLISEGQGAVFPQKIMTRKLPSGVIQAAAQSVCFVSSNCPEKALIRTPQDCTSGSVQCRLVPLRTHCAASQVTKEPQAKAAKAALRAFHRQWNIPEPW